MRVIGGSASVRPCSRNARRALWFLAEHGKPVRVFIVPLADSCPGGA